MKFPKEWKCMKCNKKKDKFDIVRVSKSLCMYGNYGQFRQCFAIDLCEECYDELLKDLFENVLKHNMTYDEYNQTGGIDYYDRY